MTTDTEYKTDTALGTLPLWAAYTDEFDDDPGTEPIAGWLRLTDHDGRVRIVPAEWDARRGELRPMPAPDRVFHSREEAEAAVRVTLAARWQHNLPLALRWISELPAEERTPARLRDRLTGYGVDRFAAAATGKRTAYEALVAEGYMTAGRGEHTMQGHAPGGGVQIEAVPAEPCELTVEGREIAGLADEKADEEV